MRSALAILALSFALLVTTARAGETQEELSKQVRDTENAFAATMAARDLEGFTSFLADEAIFSGQKRAMRGKAEVVEGWKGFFQGEKAPFSWHSESVEVLSDGTLAYSAGPVFDPQGNKVGSFHSIWRREASGKWRIVFDHGCAECACAEKKTD